MSNVGRFLFILLQCPPIIIMWTDYHTVNVLAYTRMMGNGSMDQAVVVLVNEAIFAYFNHTKKTFVLRPSASAGFSVLEKRDSTFCLTEVLKGFPRQAEYLEKLKDETRSSKPRVALPSVEVYTEFPEEQGQPNTLYCYVTEFYPGDIEINLFVNGLTVMGESSDLMYGKDWTFRVYKYISIIPQPGDVFKCEVRHSSMEKPRLMEWRPEFYKTTSHPYWFYTLFLGFFSGSAVCVCVVILRRKRHNQP